MEFVTYVLFSEKHNIHYTGFTSNLVARFYSHNITSNKGFTKKYRPWKVIYVKFHHSKNEAIKHGKYLKSGHGRAFIKTISTL